MPVIGSGGGPNIEGRDEQVKPAKKGHPSQIGGPGNRSAVKRGTLRDILYKIPPAVKADFKRREAEVEFAKESKKWSGNLDGAHKKYGHLIHRKRLQAIYDNPKKYINQLGIGAHSAIKNQQDLASMKGFEKYVRRTLDEAAKKTKKLNTYLFPGGHKLSNIVRSIHFGHGQGLMAAGPNIGGSHTGQFPLDNMRQSKWSGPSKGAMGADGWYKVDDAYSAINHPQFWDEAWSNYILGEDMPILVDLTDEAKNKVLHRGYNPDRIIIEQDNINLNRIDDDVAEYIPFKRKGPPPKGEILKIEDPSGQRRPSNVPGIEEAFDSIPGAKQLRIASKNPLVRKAAIVAGVATPFLGPLGVIASEAQIGDREREVAENPNDPVLKFQLELDKATYNADLAALEGEPIPEAVSLVTGLASLGLDAGRSLTKSSKKFIKRQTSGNIPDHTDVVKRTQERNSGLSEEDRNIYEAGGGNAAMTKYGWDIKQTMAQGYKNLLLQTPDYE